MKSLVVVVGGRKVIIVSVHVRYFSFFSFFSLCLTGYIRLRRLHQVTSVYVGGTGRGARQHNLSIFKYKILFLSALSMLIKTICWQKDILNKFLVQYVNTIIIRTLYGVMSPYLYILTLILSKHVIKMALTRILNKYKEKNCSEHKPFRKIGVINL